MDSPTTQSTEQQQQKQQSSSTHALSSSTSSPQQSSSAQAQTGASAADAAVAGTQKQQQQPSNNAATNSNTNNDNSDTVRSNLNTEQQQQRQQSSPNVTSSGTNGHTPSASPQQQQQSSASAMDKDKGSVGSHAAQASRTTTSAGGHQAAPSSEAAHTATLVSNSNPNMSTGGTSSSLAPAASTAAAHRTGGPASKQSSSAKSKASFLSRLINKLVPCVGPSAAHPIDVDHVQPRTNGADAGVANGSPPPSSVSLREKERPTTASAPAKEGEKGGANVAPVPEHQQQPSSASGPEPAQTASELAVADGTTTTDGASAPSPPPEAGNIAATGAAAIAAATNNLPPISIPPSSAGAMPLTDDEDVILPPTPVKQLLPPSETGGLTSGAVQAPGSTGEEGTNHAPHHPQQQGRESDNESDGSYTDGEDEHDDGEPHEHDEEMGLEDEEEKLISNGGAGIPIGPDGQPRPLLPPLAPHHAGRKCLVLDLDETLVHSSFKAIGNADYVVPVEIEFHWHNVYVIKRPGVDAFLKKMGEIFEIVVFTASLSKYADPVLDKLDIHHVVTHRLFRESCYNHRGNYVKDLSQLGRPIGDTIILDNSPASYLFHPNNAVPVSSWFNDPHDTELTDLCPFLTDLSGVDDVRGILDGGL